MKLQKPYNAVIGLGKTGLSVVHYLRAQGRSCVVIDTREQPPGLAEFTKNHPDVAVFSGELPKKILVEAEEVIVSPGVHLPEIEGISDIELFARTAKAPLVAITGSNGKSTVTSLVGEMAKAAGVKVGVGGNLGTPALELVHDAAELYVLELSSFQLERTISLRAAAATVLNITPDHLDRHGSMENYVAAKMRIYEGCEVAVVNRDSTSLPYTVAAPSISFGLTVPEEGQFGVANGYLLQGKRELLALSELKIKGRHQVSNALAALALGSAVKLPMAAMISALREFGGLPHRCQWAGEIAGVNWYNDSKATNVGAALAAIEGLGSEIAGKLVLIMGGQGKGADFSELQDVIARYARIVLIIGEDGPKLAEAFSRVTAVMPAASLEEAVAKAAVAAQSGDVVLLSPACASYDMFKNFEERGMLFMRYVDEYRQHQKS